MCGTDINCYKIHTKEKTVNIKVESSNIYIGQFRDIENENQWAPILFMEVKVLTIYTYSGNEWVH